jgi:hypothetical protein
MSWQMLAINQLKLLCKRQEGQLCFMHIGLRYPMLVHEPYSKNKLAVICEVLVREHAIEKTWPQAVKIEKELPSFVATG